VALAQLPRERVLAPARADEQNPHAHHCSDVIGRV
jgi:hypothetical protein